MKIFKSAFAKAIAAQTIIKAAATALGLFPYRWLTSNSSETALAEYLAIQSFLSVIQLIIDLGLARLVQKVYTNHEDPEYRSYFWSMVSLLRGLTYAAGFLLAVVAFPLTNVQNLPLILLFFTAQFLILGDQNFRAICDALGKTWQFTVTDFANRFLFVVLLLAYPLIPFNIDPLWYYLWMYFGSVIAGFSADMIWQRKSYAWRKPNWSLFKPYWKPICFLAVSSVAVASITQSRQLIVRQFLDTDLQNAFGIADKVFITSGIVSGMTMPMIASMVRKRYTKNELGPLGRKLLAKVQPSTAIILEWIGYAASFGICLAAGVYVVGPIIVSLIDGGGQYPLAVDLIRLFSLAMLPVPIAGFMSDFILFQHNGEKYELANTIVLALLGVTTYITAVTTFGVWGMVWALVVINSTDILIKCALLLRIHTRNLRGLKSNNA